MNLENKSLTVIKNSDKMYVLNYANFPLGENRYDEIYQRYIQNRKGTLIIAHYGTCKGYGHIRVRASRGREL